MSRSKVGIVVLAWFMAVDVQSAAAAGPIEPTVTVKTGDLGGTYFGRVPAKERSHHYYVAAEPELWDYAPSGRDDICGSELPAPVVVNRRRAKVRYVQYTDGTFGSKVPATPSLGILGPVLRGVVGDTLVVTFLNRLDRPLSMHPHGVKYDKDSEGSYYRPGPGRGAAVGPGATFTYVWYLDESSGPLPTEPSSKGWLYHSHVGGDDEVNDGLVGCIIVTDPKRARADGTPNDVDREFATLFLIFDESGLGEDVKEAAEYVGLPNAGPPPKTWIQVQELTEVGSRFALNGRIFGNLSGLEMNEGERTRWYLFGLGSEHDFHTAHWHGLRVVESRRRTDVVELLPASMKVADLVADNPGSWLFHCHVQEHMKEGMFARVTVYGREQVGVDRAPEQAFLGLGQSKRSLRLSLAEAVLDFSPTAAKPCELKLKGSATVFEAFSIFTQPIRIQLGKKTVVFKPDERGAARTRDGTLQITNAGILGVVYGGTMEFEVVLNGSGWRDEIQKLGPAPTAGNAREQPMILTMEIGAAQHTTQISLATTVK